MCQIASDVLTDLTDTALVATVLTYPPRADFTAFNSAEEGLAAMTGRFNGLRELFTRPGSASALQERFLSLSLEKITVTQISNDNYGFIDLDFLSTLLLHDDISSRLTDSERVAICEKAIHLQAEMRNKVGPSASEWGLANMAAAFLGSGTRLPYMSAEEARLFARPMTAATLDTLYNFGARLVRKRQ
jgi:hypothetical protein